MSDTMIAIGGCHVAGYKVGEENSFINILSKVTGLICTHRAPNYQIKKTTGIREKINTTQPDIAVLQLGNYEFNASLRQILKKKSGKSSNSGSASAGESALISGKPVMLPLVKEPKTGFFFRNLITPFIWNILKYRNRVHLHHIRDIIRENPSMQFVILSPIPCFKSSDNLVRNLAGRWYRKLFAAMPNVTYIDLFRYIAADKRYFADPGHLNATGHRILGKIVGQYIKGLKGDKEKQVAIAV